MASRAKEISARKGTSQQTNLPRVNIGDVRIVAPGWERNRKTRQAMAPSMTRRDRRPIAMGRLCLYGRRTRWKSRTLPTQVSLRGLIDQLIFEGYSRKWTAHGVSKTGL